jgi:hypothetical protein
MNLKTVIEPRMNTDETRMDNRSSSDFAHTVQVSCNLYVTHRFICVNPCSSVASKGLLG